MSSLLPEHSSPELKSLDTALGAPIAETQVDVIAELYSVDDCPAHLLDHLAFALQTPLWQINWPESIKRQKLRETPAQLAKLASKGLLRSTLSSSPFAIKVTALGAHAIACDLPLDESSAHGDLAERDYQFARIIINTLKPARTAYELTTSATKSGSVHIGAAGVRTFEINMHYIEQETILL